MPGENVVTGTKSCPALPWSDHAWTSLLVRSRSDDQARLGAGGWVRWLSNTAGQFLWLTLPGGTADPLKGSWPDEALAHLVFRVPTDVLDLSKAAPTLEQVLDWTHFEPVLTCRAVNAPLFATLNVDPALRPPPQHGPQDLDPAGPCIRVGLGNGVDLAPTETGTWWNQTTPVTRNGRVELWHCELQPTGGPLTGRAIANTDSLPAGTQLPLVDPDADEPDAAVNALVAATSDWTGTPVTLDLHQLVLTPVGPTISYALALAEPAQGKAGIERVQAALHLGRDESAQVVQTGFLYPFGHLLSIADDYRRLLDQDGRATFTAVQTTISVLQRVRDYGPTSPTTPFARIEVLSTHLPVTHRCSHVQGTLSPDVAFYPDGGADGQPYRVTLRGTDADGRTVRFSAPLLVVTEGYTSDPGYNSTPYANLDLGGQPMAWTSNSGGVAVHPTHQITLGHATAAGTNPPAFAVVAATIDHGSAAAFGDTQSAALHVIPASGRPASDQPYATIVDQGGAPTTIGLASGPGTGVRAARGIADVAALRFASLSVSHGLEPANPMGPPAALPADGNLAMTFLGVFDLSTALGGVRPVATSSVTAGTRTSVVDLRHDGPLNLAGNSDLAATAHNLRATLTVTQPVGSSPAAGKRALWVHLDDAQLTLGAVDGITLPMSDVTWSQPPAAKPTLTATLGTPSFHGALSFLNHVLAILPNDLFSNPPVLEVDPDHALLGYDLPIPDIPFGVFSLSGIDLRSELTLPFTGSGPSFLFAFASKEHPFTATVDGFAGGGYCVVGVGVDGVAVDAGISFGGSFTLDVVIATGGVSIIGSLFMALTPNQAATYGGAVDISGGVEILDIASVTLHVHIGLTYANDVWTADAEVSVRVELLWLHKTFSFEVTRTFSGSSDSATAAVRATRAAAAPAIPPSPQSAQLSTSGGTTFTAAIDAASWQSYCGAFTTA